MFDCTTNWYDALYAKWLEKPGTLLDLAFYEPNRESLLDLCGGTGAVAKEALMRGGKDVWLADLNPRCCDARVHLAEGKVEDMRLSSGHKPFDVIVCRQALGYLNLPKLAVAVNDMLAPGGRFAFNTFGEPDHFRVKSYYFNRRRYAEWSVYLLGRVLHVQYTKGLPTDVTFFKYHSPESIHRAFDRYMSECWVTHGGNSLRWVFHKPV